MKAIFQSERSGSRIKRVQEEKERKEEMLVLGIDISGFFLTNPADTLQFQLHRIFEKTLETWLGSSYLTK